MASDAVIGEKAALFLDQLSASERALWDATYRQFLANPVNEDTIEYPESGEPDGMATVAFPFLVFFRFLNPETLAIANIIWAPHHA